MGVFVFLVGSGKMIVGFRIIYEFDFFVFIVVYIKEFFY